MGIDFHSEKNRLMYASRTADYSWMTKIRELVNPEGKQIVDIGCGGGFYLRALADMGAKYVKGVDFSQPVIGAAREASLKYPHVDYSEGNALEKSRCRKP